MTACRLTGPSLRALILQVEAARRSEPRGASAEGNLHVTIQLSRQVATDLLGFSELARHSDLNL